MDRTVHSTSIRALGFAAVLAIAVVGGAAIPAVAAPSGDPTVDLGSSTGLAADGRSITIDVIASCPERWRPVQATVTIMQPQATGQGQIPLFSCDGSAHPFRVTVRSTGGVFRLGSAQATAVVVVERGKTKRAQDSAAIQLDPTVEVRLPGAVALLGGGSALEVGVSTACPLGASGAQSHVSISQGNVVGSGTFTPVCDGTQHGIGLTVTASQGTFQVGLADGIAEAFVQEGGDTFSGVDQGAIEIYAD
jgi:hypothetical protein